MKEWFFAILWICVVWGLLTSLESGWPLWLQTLLFLFLPFPFNIISSPALLVLLCLRILFLSFVFFIIFSFKFQFALLCYYFIYYFLFTFFNLLIFFSLCSNLINLLKSFFDAFKISHIFFSFFRFRVSIFST